MRIIIHSFLSLLRKPTKALMILVILFVVFSMVFTGVIIQNSISKSKEFVRLEMGAVVEYKSDFMKAYGDNLPQDEFSQLQLSKSTAETMGSDSRVEATYINYTDFMESSKYESVEGESGGGMFTLSAASGGAATFNFKATEGGVPIEFDTNKLEIIEGRNIDASDESAKDNSIVISEEFAKKNQLAINDEMTFRSYTKNKELDFVVVGIYKVKDSKMTGNDMYVSSNALSMDGYKSISSIYFRLKDPLQVDGFMADQSVHLPSKYTVLDAGNLEYETLTRPLDLMSMIASILIWVIFIAGAAIIVSLITIFVRDRKFEVGLLLASGEARLKIIGQFVLEIIMVALIAFACSVLLSFQSSQMVSEWIVENHLVEGERASGNTIVFGDSINDVNGKVSMENVADDFSVAITFDVMRNLFIISIGIVIIASLIPLVVILSYNPRQALQD
ncbi:ABC transporter permease [Acidaminobacter sp. JC074]|uniref:ABC transporter permease n=1 Tax=Acidaminobacter sp. JC074 TaxID=2530199 RepID=UPI001F0D287F|nr:ABC transporter permease [Acidaminobacter sp. JC074]